MSCVIYHLSPATCHLPPGTCHLSPTATATALDHPPANSSTIHSCLVHQDRTSKENKKKWLQASKNKNGFLFIQFYRYTLWPQVYMFFLFLVAEVVDKHMTYNTSTDIATSRLNWPRCRFIENLLNLITVYYACFLLPSTYFSPKTSLGEKLPISNILLFFIQPGGRKKVSFQPSTDHSHPAASIMH